MRKLLWLIPALAFMVIGSPAARADTTVYTPTFTCSSGCTTPPTASSMTFSSPTINGSYDGQTFSVNLNPSDQAGDTYGWVATFQNLPGTAGPFCLTITDNTNGFSDVFTFSAGSFPVDTLVVGFGLMNMCALAPVPEPSTLFLILAGMVGLLLISRKRIFKGAFPPA